MDRKDVQPSLKRVYQTLIAQNRIYKTSKYGKINTVGLDTSFMSPKVLNLNFYELSNDQISQLFQDLIKNDMNVKGSKQKVLKPHDFETGYKRNSYGRNSGIDEYDDEYNDDNDYEEENNQSTQDSDEPKLVYKDGKFLRDFSEDEFNMEEDEEEYVDDVSQNIKESERNLKYKKKYDYFYDDTAFNVLLKRNLESVDNATFKKMLTGEIKVDNSEMVM